MFSLFYKKSPVRYFPDLHIINRLAIKLRCQLKHLWYHDIGVEYPLRPQCWHQQGILRVLNTNQQKGEFCQSPEWRHLAERKHGEAPSHGNQVRSPHHYSLGGGAMVGHQPTQNTQRFRLVQFVNLDRFCGGNVQTEGNFFWL